MKERYIKIGILIVIIIAIFALVFRYYMRNSSYYKPKVETDIASSKIEGVDIKSLLVWEKDTKGSAIYPVVNGKKNINKIIEDYIKGNWDEFLQDVDKYKQTHDMKKNAKFEINITTETPFAEKEAISFVFQRLRFVQGETKKENTVNTLNFDRVHDKQIGLSDFFVKDSDYLTNLSKLAEKSLINQLKKQNLDTNEYDLYTSKIFEKTKPEFENFKKFAFLEDEYIAIYYNEGEVLPQNLGNVRAVINLRDIDDTKFNLDTLSIVYPNFYSEIKNGNQHPPAQNPPSEPESPPLTPTNPTFRNVDCNKNKCIAFTFDDGPHATYTPAILDEFDKHGGKATFYILGNRAEYYPSILKRMSDNGFEIGNHTWSHKDLTNLSPSQITEEVQSTQDIVLKITGTSTLTVRPPYGAYNAMVSETVKYPLVLWSIDTKDWEEPSPELIKDRVLSNATPGSIVLMHDIHGNSLDALPFILDTLQNEGYVFVTITEMVGTKPQGTVISKG